MRVFVDLMWFFKAFRRDYLLGAFFLVAVSLLGLIPPEIVGRVVNGLMHHSLTPAALWRFLILILVLTICSYGLRYLWRVRLFGGAARLEALLRDRLYHHFTRLSPEFYLDHRIGDLMAHATNDIQAIQDTAGEGILMMVDSVISGVSVVLTMAIAISWKLTIISLLPLPIMALVISRYGRMLHERFMVAQEAFSDINDRVQEYISGIRIVRAFGQEAWEREGFVALSRDVVEKNVAVAKIDSLFDPTISIIVGFSYFLAVAMGAVYVVRGSMTIGGLTAFTLYLGQLIWPMMAFGFLFNVMERGSASYDRVSHLLSIEPRVVDRDQSLVEVPRGTLIMTVPRFCYPHTEAAALRDINLVVKPGTTVGIVGRTGAGKTTLMRLILRQFDLGNGDITIGGTSIYRYHLDSLRQAIAYAPQDDFLFSMSIRDNIAFQNPAASRQDVERVALMAGIHEDILRFADGYETLVGERGVTLSGGQKQRVSIARALLADAQILLLDDTLSAVDAKTEAAILSALRTNREGRTTVIATHRLSAVEHADDIVVLERGRVVEQGSHRQLLGLRGRYFEMHRRQQLESLVEWGSV